MKINNNTSIGQSSGFEGVHNQAAKAGQSGNLAGISAKKCNSPSESPSAKGAGADSAKGAQNSQQAQEKGMKEMQKMMKEIMKLLKQLMSQMQSQNGNKASG